METTEVSADAPETTSTEATTIEAPETTTSGVEISAKQDEGAGEKEATEKPAAPAYTPNYKLKVYDEEKDLEDPFLKNLIKDADSEKKVKEIAQKYLGFEKVKERFEKSQADLKQYQSVAQPVITVYNTATQMLQKKDYDSFFEYLNIPMDDIFKFAVKKAEEAQLPESQRNEIHQQRQNAKERDYLAAQNQSLQERQQQQLAQFRNQELNWVLARPEVHSVAQAFETKNGPGSFRQLVVDKGLAHYAATHQDLSAEQAVQEVMKMVGAFVTPANGAGIPTQPQAPLIQQNGQPPIIPNVASRSSSPVRKQVRSIADLKKRREELTGS